MKRFNVSILAVVAVLAIGLTAFTKAEPAGKRSLETNCYRNVVAAYTDACTLNSITLQPGSACPSASVLGRGLSAAPTNFIQSPVTIDCDGGSFFCCADIVVDPSPCDAQPVVSFRNKAGVLFSAKASIQQIYCKSTIN